jgi:carboxymethylenebutenolidase
MINDPSELDEELVQLTALDGHQFNAVRILPPQRNGIGLIIIQEFFGVNEHIRELCRRYACEGFTVISPVLFHRVDRTSPYGLSLPYEEASVSIGRKLRTQVGWDNAMRDVAASIATLNTPTVAVLGYCWGGTLAWLAATRLGVNCAIGYYGGQIHEFAHERPRCAVMLHFGARDDSIPLERVDLVRSAHPLVTIHIYPEAGHSFNCDKSPKFHAESSQLALARTDARLTGLNSSARELEHVETKRIAHLWATDDRR